MQKIDPDCYDNLVDFIAETCETFGSGSAFENRGSRLSYATVYGKSQALAAYLQEILKLKKGDRVALMMPNLLQYPVALFGVLMAGGVVVNVNPQSAPPELAHELKDSGAEILIAFRGSLKVIEALEGRCAIKQIILTEIGDLLSALNGFFINIILRFAEKRLSYSGPPCIAFKVALRQGKDCVSAFQKPVLKGEDLAFLQYTGGTTGVAKGAMLSHRNIIANIEQASAWLKPWLLQHAQQSIIITALPLYHVFSLMANLWTFFKIGALNILITDPRQTKALIKVLRSVPFDAMTGVNTLFKSLVNHPDFSGLSFKRKSIVLSGGMPLEASVAQAWKSKTGVPIIEAYGLTEASPAVCINPFDLACFNGSVGLPLSATEISIRDPQGLELGFNEPGELWIKGPQVMQGYWHQPQDTTLVLKEGYLNSGDIATIDEQGFIRIVDRAKDMILVSGFKVYPTEVESVICQMPGVLEVAVCGISENGVEQVAAFIVKRDPTLSKDRVLEFCHQQLSAYKVPKIIEFRETLPKTTVGKVLRRLLKNPKS